MKSDKKYEFTGETIKHDNRTLKRIRRLSDGLIGGFIESEHNLSHNGNAQVSDNAQVFGDALVSDDAKVFGDTQIYGNDYETR